MPTVVPTLGALLRAIRGRQSWTLKEMSAHCSIPVSTLSKIEHDRLTLSYDKLQQLSQWLGLRMSELFAESSETAPQPVTARRSIGTSDNAVRVETSNYDYYYQCTELRKKRMIPVFVKIRATSTEQFGALVRHDGEEYIYVLKGRVIVTTEFYDPVTLEEGQSIYLDSTMGHAYVAADGCAEAEVIGVMSSANDDLMQALLTVPADRDSAAPPSKGTKRRVAVSRSSEPKP